MTQNQVLLAELSVGGIIFLSLVGLYIVAWVYDKLAKKWNEGEAERKRQLELREREHQAEMRLRELRIKQLEQELDEHERRHSR